MPLSGARNCLRVDAVPVNIRPVTCTENISFITENLAAGGAVTLRDRESDDVSRLEHRRSHVFSASDAAEHRSVFLAAVVDQRAGIQTAAATLSIIGLMSTLKKEAACSSETYVTSTRLHFV
jgi:hypothetical protein